LLKAGRKRTVASGEQATTLDGPTGRMQVPEGSTYRRGTLFMGVELAKWLDQQLGLEKGGLDENR
jgi:hypothetical protein